MSITSKQIHCGQYKRNDDFYRVWEIYTEEKDKEKILEYCRENLYKRIIPNSTEWQINIGYGGSKRGDAGYYFAGYYTLTQTDYGFKFTVCEPYAD